MKVLVFILSFFSCLSLFANDKSKDLKSKSEKIYKERIRAMKKVAEHKKRKRYSKRYKLKLDKK